MSGCKRVFSVGFGPGLDSVSPTRSWRSASHAAGSHDWLPKKMGAGPPERQERWIHFHSPPSTATHQPHTGCTRLVLTIYIIIVSSNRYLPSSMQDFAVSLNVERSSKVQGRARRMHCSMCAVFSVVKPHSHVVSSSKYCLFFRCSLLHV